MVMRYENRSFTLPASSGDISDEKWEEIFGARRSHDIVDMIGPEDMVEVTVDAVDTLLDEEEEREIHEIEEHISRKCPSIAQADGYSGDETAEMQSSIDKLIGTYEHD